MSRHSDTAEYWRDGDEVVRALKAKRREQNLAYLAKHNIQWTWVDRNCDHILIDGEIDYYLGKTYWHNRKTGKSGYAMLSRLLAERGE